MRHDVCRHIVGATGDLRCNPLQLLPGGQFRLPDGASNVDLEFQFEKNVSSEARGEGRKSLLLAGHNRDASQSRVDVVVHIPSSIGGAKPMVGRIAGPVEWADDLQPQPVRALHCPDRGPRCSARASFRAVADSLVSMRFSIPPMMPADVQHFIPTMKGTV